MTGRPSSLLRAAALGTAVSLLANPAAGATKKKRRPPEPTAVPRPPDPYRVTLTTSDGVSLAASWRPVPDHPRAPALLLVHDFSRERRDWEGVAADLTASGFATLAIDLRAHGESTRKAGSGKPLAISPRLLTDENAFPRDVQAACAWLRERAPRVGILGLSLGGNLAVLATASGWADAAVAVSPNIEKLEALAGERPSAAKATLFLAAEEDPGRARSAREFLASAAEPKKMLLFAGAAHNLTLFTEHPESRKAALEWLTERLNPVTMSARASTMSAAGPSAVPSPAPAQTPSPAPR